MDSSIGQRECELSWLDACEDRQVFRWCGPQASSDNAQSIIENAVDETSMRTTTPNWCAVLSGGVDEGKSRDAQYLGTCTPSRSRTSILMFDEEKTALFACNLNLINNVKTNYSKVPLKKACKKRMVVTDG